MPRRQMVGVLGYLLFLAALGDDVPIVLSGQPRDKVQPRAASRATLLPEISVL